MVEGEESSALSAAASMTRSQPEPSFALPVVLRRASVTHLVAVLERDHPKPVVLELMDPVLAARNLRGEHRLARDDEAGLPGPATRSAMLMRSPNRWVRRKRLQPVPQCDGRAQQSPPSILVYLVRLFWCKSLVAKDFIYLSISAVRPLPRLLCRLLDHALPANVGRSSPIIAVLTRSGIARPAVKTVHPVYSRSNRPAAWPLRSRSGA